MSEHPNVTVINRMTEAAIAGDKKALASCFTEDMVFHVRGTLPRVGDHRGRRGLPRMERERRHFRSRSYPASWLPHDLFPPWERCRRMEGLRRQAPWRRSEVRGVKSVYPPGKIDGPPPLTPREEFELDS
jgi:hypothetical protein